MAIAFRGAASNSVLGSSTATVVIPSAVAAGDGMVAYLTLRSTDTPTTPGGWTLVDSATGSGTFAMSVYAYSRVAQAGDAGATLSIAHSDVNTALLEVVAYSGTDTAALVNAHAAAGSSADGTTATSPSVTTGVDGCQVSEGFGAVANASGTDTVTGPSTQRTSVAINFWGACASDQAQATAGASGTQAAAVATSSAWAAVTVALAPLSPDALVAGAAAGLALGAPPGAVAMGVGGQPTGLALAAPVGTVVQRIAGAPAALALAAPPGSVHVPVPIASWTADESQQCNLDLRVSGVLRAAPKTVVPSGPVVVDLERVSEVYPAPALGSDGMPTPGSWLPSSTTREAWGRWQVVVGGVDVTFFRGHATQIGAITYNEPFGDDTVDLIFGMVGPFEAPGTGALSWMADGADVEVYHVLPGGTVDRANPMFEGRYLARDIESGGRSGSGGGGEHGEGAERGAFSRTLHCLGAVYAADLLVKTPAVGVKTVIDETGAPVQWGDDLRNLVAAELDPRSAAGVLHLAPTVGDQTGIVIAAKGSGTQLVNGYIQDLLGQASVSPRPGDGAAVVGLAARPDGGGYWLAASDGMVVAFGGRTFYGGSMVGRPLVAPVSGMAATPSGLGYWLCAEDGGVFAFGDAGFHGEEAAPGAPVIAIAATSTGLGYWLLDQGGGVYAFGDAAFHGDPALSGGHLAVAIAGAADRGGYWVLDDAGHVFAEGSAGYHGIAATASPAVGLAPTGTEAGYWVVDDAGQVYALGDAVYHGNTPTPLNQPAFGIAKTPSSTGGYTIAAADGGVFALGDAVFYGSIPGNGGQWQGWTVAKLPGRVPAVVLKNRWRVDATVRAGQPGVALSLQVDETTTTKAVYGEGTDEAGHRWRNTKYPNLRPGAPPIWPGVTLGLGTVHASVQTWTQAMHDAGWAVNVGTLFDGAAQTACRAFQLANGLEVTGSVGAQTWAATFVTGADNGDLTGAYVSPLAELPGVEPYLYDAYGGRIGSNPAFDRTLPRVERWETFGEHVGRRAGEASALAELARDSTAGVVGTVTLTADPNEGSRYDLRAGMNLLVQGLEGRDVFLHVAQASIAWGTAGRPVTLTVDEHARDLLTVAALRSRDRSTTDPVRRIRHSRRASRIVPDTAAPWDFEAGGGIVPAFALAAGLWSVVRIPAAEAGTVVQASLTTASPASRFAVGVFGQPVTPAQVKAVVPNPLADPGAGASVWDALGPSFGFVIGWGQHGDACGYSPRQEADAGAALTGVFADSGAWPFRSLIPPWLWVAVYAETGCTVSGRLYPEPVSAS